MATQQVVSDPADSALFLTLTVSGDAASAARVREVLGEVSGLTRSVGFRHNSARLVVNVAVGARLWPRLTSAAPPKDLHVFEEIVGERHTAVSTAGDVLVHVRAASMGMCWEAARLILDKLGDAVTVVDEVHGFRYFDNRDLLGFVDGTENPEGDDALAAALVGDDDPEHVGGSYVLVQRYSHDMAAWNALSTEEQERVIGRTKLDDVELDEDVKPSNSHVALNDVSDDEGNDLDIFRLNMPFGDFTSGQFGTYFIGYAADPGVTEQMLRNMFLGDPPGNYDRILDFSTAETGVLFFMPSVDALDAFPELPEPDAEHDAEAADAASSAPRPDAPSDGAAAGSAAPARAIFDAASASAGQTAAPSAPGDGSLGIGKP